MSSNAKQFFNRLSDKIFATLNYRFQDVKLVKIEPGLILPSVQASDAFSFLDELPSFKKHNDDINPENEGNYKAEDKAKFESQTLHVSFVSEKTYRAEMKEMFVTTLRQYVSQSSDVTLVLRVADGKICPAIESFYPMLVKCLRNRDVYLLNKFFIKSTIWEGWVTKLANIIEKGSYKLPETEDLMTHLVKITGSYEKSQLKDMTTEKFWTSFRGVIDKSIDD